MNLQSNDYSSWFTNLKEDIKPEYSAKKITSVLSFYKLSGRRSKLEIENLVPIENVAYSVRSEAEDRYYLHTFRNYPIENLFWYRPTLTFRADCPEVESLRRYVTDGKVHILYTPEQVAEMVEMLERVYSSKWSGKGQMDYGIYIDLLDQSLKLQDYKQYGSSLRGFKTVCNQFEMRIEELWKMALEKNKTKIDIK